MSDQSTKLQMFYRIFSHLFGILIPVVVVAAAFADDKWLNGSTTNREVDGILFIE